ncbi:uncharacterized protein [Eleutherodactylus coqui]|uniref:uncharacterized protein n=1 Tax=Eleutherodactylus coqui TaxID=57060 RepID=UPI00346211FA
MGCSIEGSIRDRESLIEETGASSIQRLAGSARPRQLPPAGSSTQRSCFINPRYLGALAGHERTQSQTSGQRRASRRQGQGARRRQRERARLKQRGSRQPTGLEQEWAGYSSSVRERVSARGGRSSSPEESQQSVSHRIRSAPQLSRHDSDIIRRRRHIYSQERSDRDYPGTSQAGRAQEAPREVRRQPSPGQDIRRRKGITARTTPLASPEVGQAEFRSGKKRPHKECDDPPTVHSSSSSSYTNVMGSHQQSSSGGSSRSSSIAATYTNVNNPKERSYVPEMFGGEIRTVTDTPHISQNSLKDKTSKIQEKDSLKGTCTAETSEVGAVENPANPGPSSSDGNCFSEARSERPSSSHTQGKTSKTLSPDILHLLKGKDANTVTNILRTLSPFYPALQDVNLEILAQVLVNTGALD